jgi:hypothetical protein
MGGSFSSHPFFIALAVALTCLLTKRKNHILSHRERAYR